MRTTPVTLLSPIHKGPKSLLAQPSTPVVNATVSLPTVAVSGLPTPPPLSTKPQRIHGRSTGTTPVTFRYPIHKGPKSLLAQPLMSPANVIVSLSMAAVDVAGKRDGFPLYGFSPDSFSPGGSHVGLLHTPPPAKLRSSSTTESFPRRRSHLVMPTVNHHLAHMQSHRR